MSVTEFHPLQGSEFDEPYTLSGAQQGWLDEHVQTAAVSFYPDGSIYVETTDGPFVINREGEET